MGRGIFSRPPILGIMALIVMLATFAFASPPDAKATASVAITTTTVLKAATGSNIRPEIKSDTATQAVAVRSNYRTGAMPDKPVTATILSGSSLGNFYNAYTKTEQPSLTDYGQPCDHMNGLARIAPAVYVEPAAMTVDIVQRS